MTDQDHICARCGRPMRHDTALIDTSCANLLRRHLEDVAKIAGDINLTVARLDHIARHGGQVDDLGWWRADEYVDPRRPGTNLAVRVMTDRSALPPVAMPPRTDIAERHDAAVGELNTWAQLVIDQRGFGQVVDSWMKVAPTLAQPLWSEARLPHPLTVTVSSLIGSIEWLRHQPFADEAWPALLAACAELVRIVDTREPGELIGLCSCGTARYSTESVCPRCRSEDLEHDRSALEAKTAQAIVTASEAARWVVDMGLVLDSGKLRKLIWAWADRGHLTAVDDIPRYRFGDVLARVMQSPALRAA